MFFKNIKRFKVITILFFVILLLISVLFFYFNSDKHLESKINIVGDISDFEKESIISEILDNPDLVDLIKEYDGKFNIEKKEGDLCYNDDCTYYKCSYKSDIVYLRCQIYQDGENFRVEMKGSAP